MLTARGVWGRFAFIAALAPCDLAAQLGDSVLVSVRVPAVVRAGRPVPIRVSLTNRLNRPVRLEVPARQPPVWNLRITAANELVVWMRRDRSTGFAHGVLTLAPRATFTRTILWDQRDMEGRSVARSVYRVRAFLYAPTLPRGRFAEAAIRIR